MAKNKMPSTSIDQQKPSRSELGRAGPTSFAPPSLTVSLDGPSHPQQPRKNLALKLGDLHLERRSGEDVGDGANILGERLGSAS